MQEIRQQAAALASALRQWELRLQRLHDEAADADFATKEQFLKVKGLRLREKQLAEDAHAFVAQGDVSCASAAQQERQQLEREISSQEVVLADCNSAAQQLHADVKECETEADNLRQRAFLCTCIQQLARDAKHWEKQWETWQQHAEDAGCRVAQGLDRGDSGVLNSPGALCVRSDGAQQLHGPDAVDTGPAASSAVIEQGAVHAEEQAAKALTELHKSQHSADMLRSCMLSLSCEDELTAQCCEAEKALNEALLEEQDLTASLISSEESEKAELERIAARIAEAAPVEFTKVALSYQELFRLSKSARQQLLGASLQVRERRSRLQKLQIHKQACKHMETLIRSAFEHDCTRKDASHEADASPREVDDIQDQYQSAHQVPADSRESTLTVAEGIPQLEQDSSSHAISTDMSEGYNRSHSGGSNSGEQGVSRPAGLQCQVLVLIHLLRDSPNSHKVQVAS